MKMQGVAKCCGCLVALRLRASLEKFLWVIIRIGIDSDFLLKQTIYHEF